jgi:hypothetical protein
MCMGMAGCRGQVRDQQWHAAPSATQLLKRSLQLLAADPSTAALLSRPLLGVYVAVPACTHQSPSRHCDAAHALVLPTTPLAAAHGTLQKG